MKSPALRSPKVSQSLRSPKGSNLRYTANHFANAIDDSKQTGNKFAGKLLKERGVNQLIARDLKYGSPSL
jgi:hypothetical protein